MADFDEQPLPELQLPLAPTVGYDLVGFKRLMMPWTCTMLFEEHESHEIANLPGTMNCIVISNKHNCIMLMDVHGLHIHPLSQMRENFLTMPEQFGLEAKVRVDTPTRPYCVRISCDDTRIAIALFNGAVAVYDLQACLDETNKKPLEKASVPADPRGVPVKDLQMNTGDQPSYLALLYGTIRNENTGIRIWDMNAGSMVAEWSHPVGFTSMCWSTRGKQIVTGCGDGKLRQWTQKGELKAEIPAPPCTSALSVQSVCWLSNTDFMTAYCRGGSLDTSHVATVLVRHDGKLGLTGYLRFGDTQLNPPLASVQRVPNRMFIPLGAWTPFGNLVLHWTSNSATLVPLAQITQEALNTAIPSNKLQLPSIEYAILDPEPPFEPAMPDEELMGDNSEPSLLGAAIDLMATGTIPGTEFPAGPILWTLTTKGNYVAHWLVNRSSVPYPGMGAVRPTPAVALSSAAPSTQPSFGSLPKSASATFGGFSSSQSAPSWGSGPSSDALGNRTISKPSGLQAGAFSAIAGGTRSFSQFAGTSQTTSAFGGGTGSKDFDMSGLESEAAVLGTGQPSGTTAGAANFGQPISTSGFGSSLPSWGQPTRGGVGFGQPSATASTTMSFGQPQQPSAGFGQPQTANTFGQLARQTSLQSSTGFGAPSVPSASFSTSASTSSFGATNPQLLSGVPLTSSFGQPSTTASPSFGQSPVAPTSRPSPMAGLTTTFGQLASTSATYVAPANAFGIPTSAIPSGTSAPPTRQLSSTPSISRAPITKAEADVFFKNLPKFSATSAPPAASGSVQPAAPPVPSAVQSPDVPPASTTSSTSGPSLAESRDFFKKLLTGANATPAPPVQAIGEPNKPIPAENALAGSKHPAPVNPAPVASFKASATAASPSTSVHLPSSAVVGKLYQSEGEVAASEMFAKQEQLQPKPAVEGSLPDRKSVTPGIHSHEGNEEVASALSTVKELGSRSEDGKKQVDKVDSKPARASDGGLPNVLGLSLGPLTAPTSQKSAEERTPRLAPALDREPVSTPQPRSVPEIEKNVTPKAESTPVSAPAVLNESDAIRSGARLKESTRSSGSGDQFYAATQVAAETAKSLSTSLKGFFNMTKKSSDTDEALPSGIMADPKSASPVSVVPAGGWPDGRIPAFHVAEGSSAPSQGQGITAEALRLRSMMEEELRQIQETVAKCRAFHLQLSYASLPARALGDLRDAKLWNFGDLHALSKLMQDLRNVTMIVRDSGVTYKRLSIELEALILKGETKKEECDRYIRLRDETTLEAVRKAKHLGPAQSENQSRLRKSSQLLYQRIQDLEDCVSGLRARIKQRKAGTIPFTAPTLDTVNRIIRNLDLAASTELALLEKQKARLDDAATAAPRASRSNSRTVSGKAPSNLASALSYNSSSPRVSRKQVKTADTRQSARQLKAILSERFAQPLLNTTVINATPMDDRTALTSDLNFAISSGPLSLVSKDEVSLPSATKPALFSGPRPAAWDALLAAPYVPPLHDPSSSRGADRRKKGAGGEGRHTPAALSDPLPVPPTHSRAPLAPSPALLSTPVLSPSALAVQGGSAPAANVTMNYLRPGTASLLPTKNWLAAVPPISKTSSTSIPSARPSTASPQAVNPSEFHAVLGKPQPNKVILSEEQIKKTQELWGSLGTVSGTGTDEVQLRKAGTFQPWTPVAPIRSPTVPLPTSVFDPLLSQASDSSTAKTIAAHQDYKDPPEPTAVLSATSNIQPSGRPIGDQALNLDQPQSSGSDDEARDTDQAAEVEHTQSGHVTTPPKAVEPVVVHKAANDAVPGCEDEGPAQKNARSLSGRGELVPASTPDVPHKQSETGSGYPTMRASATSEAPPSSSVDLAPAQGPSQPDFRAWLTAVKVKPASAAVQASSESHKDDKPQVSAEALAFAQKFEDWKAAQEKQKSMAQATTEQSRFGQMTAASTSQSTSFEQPVKSAFGPGGSGLAAHHSSSFSPSSMQPFKSAFGPGGSGLAADHSSSPSLSVTQPFKSAFGPGGSGLATAEASSTFSPAASTSSTSFGAASVLPGFFSNTAKFQRGADTGPGILRPVEVHVPAHLIPPSEPRKYVLGRMTKEEYDEQVRKAEEARQRRREAGIDSDEEEEQTEEYYEDEGYYEDGQDEEGLSEVPEEEYEVIDD